MRVVTAATLGQRIRALRRLRGWTQVELAAEVGVWRFTVTRWETDETYPTLLVFMRLATVLEVPAADLWRGLPA